MLNTPIAAVESGDRVQHNSSAPSGGLIAPPATIDFEAIKRSIRRNRWIILGAIGLAMAAGIIITMLMRPEFTAKSSVQIEQRSERILDSEELQPMVAPQESERFLATQIDILSSRRLALKLIEAEGLLTDADFLAVAGVSDPGEMTEARLRETLINYLSDRSNFDLPYDTRIVNISFTDPSATRAAKIANAYAEVFIQDNIDRKIESGDYARTFLNSQLADAKLKLEESERELNSYARASGVIQLPEKEGVQGISDTITTRTLVSLNDSASAAEARRVEAEANWRRASSTPANLLPEVLTNSAYQALQAERTRAVADLDKELAVHKPDHPNAQAIQARLDAINEQGNRIAAQIKGSIRAGYDSARAQEATLKDRVAALQGEFLTEQDRSVQQNILKREVDTTRVLYDDLLQRVKEVGAQTSITANNITLLDQATPPLRPSSPRVAFNMMLSLFIGIVLAALATAIRTLADDRLRSAVDVQNRLHIPVLGSIPAYTGTDEVSEVFEDPKSEQSEAIHSLRTSFLLRMGTIGKRSVVVTSSEPSEGKSTTLLALARDLARLGKRVLLVDADLRRPRLHHLLKISDRTGLSDVLAEAVPAAQAIHHIGSGVDALLAGSTIDDSASVLNSERFVLFTKQLEDEYDFVLFDGPPVLGLADAPTLAMHVGAVIFVLESDRARVGKARIALGRLTATDAVLLGALLTKVDLNQDGYGYGSNYYEYASSEA
ncbi:GumC family protein [Qipengyuania marisflavi]|uniref:non-specific protein-tyrosine kinase n=1 Tax=Qipengyuania marisflavi TaxID=2486356 RepID=A0A5S3P7A9_9SPHN|nr:polysaccharide biosynthesis tyrosine autokinase [Qipengyuania marisflavi]TMM46736.1 hypothetical protein FEV51_10920 [Qipengyuania marisflavi]